MSQHFTASSQGPRATQDDAFACIPHLIVVADGMGGYDGGAAAAAAAVQAIVDELENASDGTDIHCDEADIQSAFSWASREVSNSSPGGTTLAVLITCQDEALIAWVGDSRIYLLCDGELTQLSHDHVGIDGGLTRWLPEEPQPEILTLSLAEGDAILLCTDGLTNALDETEITDAMLDEEDPATALVESALEAGTDDNCTAVVYIHD